jgi:patatin-like phospholipase/acyl hydrolase
MSGRLILTIDGGGSHGFFSHHVVGKMTAADQLKHVDLVVGVSAGAFIGALVANNMISSLTDTIMLKYSDTIFGTKSKKGPWFSPTYSGIPKREALHSIFGDMVFGDLKTPMVVLVDCVGDAPEVFKSWDPIHKQIPLVKILDATSAIPVLFPPVTINQKQYMDGGTVTNSPVSIGFLVGMSLYPGETLSLVSIGTKMLEPESKSKDKSFQNTEMGIVQLVALGVPLKIIRQGAAVTNSLTKLVLGPRFMRIEGEIVGCTKDMSTQSECVRSANVEWENNRDIFLLFAASAKQIML